MESVIKWHTGVPIELGLKPETADMYYATDTGIYEVPYNQDELLGALRLNTAIPAWSLHRLIEIYNSCNVEFYLDYEENCYEQIIEWIEEKINNGRIPKEYLNR